uniref:Uncharacterized protein n=1 Tax=Zea mays TaxID=4577 RepID=A0A804Q5F8_MAIZE
QKINKELFPNLSFSSPNRPGVLRGKTSPPPNHGSRLRTPEPRADHNIQDVRSKVFPFKRKKDLKKKEKELQAMEAELNKREREKSVVEVTGTWVTLPMLTLK